MKIQHTIPPAAAPLDMKSIVHGVAGMFMSETYMKRLEHEIKDYFGVRHVFFVSSGKAALTIILKALKSLSPGKTQVLIPAYTCFSVPSAVVKAGLTVSLCDVDPRTFDFDGELLEDAVNVNTLCVVPDHLFGIPADIEKVRDVCKGRGIFVVEDAAQAMGGKSREGLLGTIGDVGFFSLGRGKNITCGSGGIIVTDSDVIANAIEKEYVLLEESGVAEVIREFIKAVLLSIFIHPSLFWLPAGLPFLRLGETVFYKDFPMKKLSGMHAGLMWDFRKELESSNEMRKKNSARFKDRLRLPSVPGEPIAFLRFPLVVQNREIREKVLSVSQEKGLGITRLYPTAINEITEIRDHFGGMAFPVAREIADCLLTLPTHHLLSKQDRENICRYLEGRGEATSLKESVIEG
jgi:dTDP-4-amino-4,6-dideoxygalactose transaminase